jgi:hypothetical protein
MHRLFWSGGMGFTYGVSRVGRMRGGGVVDFALVTCRWLLGASKDASGMP